MDVSTQYSPSWYRIHTPPIQWFQRFSKTGWPFSSSDRDEFCLYHTFTEDSERQERLAKPRTSLSAQSSVAMADLESNLSILYTGKEAEWDLENSPASHIIPSFGMFTPHASSLCRLGKFCHGNWSSRTRSSQGWILIAWLFFKKLLNLFSLGKLLFYISAELHKKYCRVSVCACVFNCRCSRIPLVVCLSKLKCRTPLCAAEMLHCIVRIPIFNEWLHV